MTHVEHWWNSAWVTTAERWLGHVVAMVAGFVMMVIGLALGVTMIMLPVGVVVGLIGVALFVGGLFARIDRQA
jgi:hypothetical protein